ncbi:MAG: PEP/pyruvate-binding domain-containing protein [Myxococcota bacterium]
MIVLLLVACRPPEGDDVCETASRRLGETVCLTAIEDEPDWDTVAVDAGVVDQVDGAKYLVPARADAPLPAVFVNSERYALHYDFLREAFPAEYATLSWDAYVAMVIDPDARVYWGGDVSEYVEADGAHRFGFIVWDDPADPATLPTYAEVLAVWEALSERFALGELMFVPSSVQQRDAAELWDGAPFDVRGESDLTYEAYNPVEGYGTVRFVTLDELADDPTQVGWQDVVVLDEAPMDLERVVSGIVTGTRQAALSHLNVRMSARGTPNCYLADPFEALAAWEGRLVRIACGEAALEIGEATAEEAEAWWDGYRPDPVEIPSPDLADDTVLDLLAVPTDTLAERDAALARYGAKGANLATLYQRIDADLQLDGFVVPFALYDRFTRANTLDGVSLADTIVAWHADPDFGADATLREARLAALREAFLAGEVDPADLALVTAHLPAERMMRVRSSSNAEDGLEFSGAGLYESASACLADSLDGDGEGPSRCDPDKDDERTVEDALRAVWASLWSDGAWEERDWYGIDHTEVAMGLLVNEQSEDEESNVVAFTGDPVADSARWLVEAQAGDLDVVSAEPGVTPERTYLTVEDGEVTDIDRVDASSEVDPGERVLSDARLEEIGALLAEVDAVMPRDDAVTSGTFMWDTEQKVLGDGRLVVKQVRPFLRE